MQCRGCENRSILSRPDWMKLAGECPIRQVPFGKHSYKGYALERNR